MAHAARANVAAVGGEAGRIGGDAAGFGGNAASDGGTAPPVGAFPAWVGAPAPGDGGNAPAVRGNAQAVGANVPASLSLPGFRSTPLSEQGEDLRQGLPSEETSPLHGSRSEEWEAAVSLYAHLGPGVHRERRPAYCARSTRTSGSP